MDVRWIWGRMGLAVALLMALAACSSRPYSVPASKDLRDEVALNAEEGSGPQPALFGMCYNSALTDETALLDEARLHCAAGELVRSEDDVLWTACGLLQPQRANFLCTPKN